MKYNKWALGEKSKFIKEFMITADNVWKKWSIVEYAKNIKLGKNWFFSVDIAKNVLCHLQPDIFQHIF